MIDDSLGSTSAFLLLGKCFGKVLGLFASASASARRSSSRGTPASCSICQLASMVKSSKCDSRPTGGIFGKAGRAAAQAKTMARDVVDHSGGHRSHAAAIDSSSHPGNSHTEATSQGILLVSREVAAQPRCKPQAREARTMPPVTLVNPWPTIIPLRASMCTGDEKLVATSSAAKKGTCNAAVMDALPSQSPISRTGWLHFTRVAIAACMSFGHADGLWRHRPESRAKPRAIAAQNRMWDR